MAAQQIAIAETIRSLKLALAFGRQASQAEDSSEDDADGLHSHSNRGNKLRPSAQYAHSGRLDSTGGTRRYKRKVSHAGYERHVINKKPKLYDEDGDVVDPLDLPSDVERGDERLYAEALQEDPFGEVDLVEVLRPLTSAAEVAEHPGYRPAFTSRALTEMAAEAAEMVRRETSSLWKAKRLLERFRGDGGWMEGQRFETHNDLHLLSAIADGDELVADYTADASADLEDADRKQPPDGEAPMANGDAAPVDTQPRTTEEGAQASWVAQAANPAIIDLIKPRDEDEGSTSNSNPSAPSHAMTTRARARSPQLPTSPSPSPSDSASIPTVHPWFHAPANALSDRDLGLPASEAEDTRKLLLLYVQKQENIIRQLNKLYSGLQRTDRLRREVYQAAKAEGHMKDDGKGGVVTEMSDGEDWYDPADWDLKPWELLDGRLEKGKDEVEDPAEEEGRRVGGRRRRVVGR